MPKNINWQKPHSNAGDMPLKEFRDPMTGKRLNSIGEPRDESFAKPRPVGSDLNSKQNRDGST